MCLRMYLPLMCYLIVDKLMVGKDNLMVDKDNLTVAE